jgi:hypothetical protein
MGDVIRKPFNIVRQVNVDDETLKRIAELLGIPEAERDRIISGEIHIAPPQPPASGSAAESTPSGSSSPSPSPSSGGAPPPGGRRR